MCTYKDVHFQETSAVYGRKVQSDTPFGEPETDFTAKRNEAVLSDRQRRKPTSNDWKMRATEKSSGTVIFQMHSLFGL